MRNLTAIGLAFLFAGCSVIAKPAPKMSYYTLAGEFKRCNDSRAGKLQVYIEPVRSGGAHDSRSLIITQNEQATPFDNAKWIAAPSDMIYENIMGAVTGSCELEASFDRQNLTLRTNLISFQATSEHAQIALGFSVLSGDKILDSGVFTSAKPLASTQPDDIAAALNLSLDEITGEILKNLTQKRK